MPQTFYHNEIALDEQLRTALNQGWEQDLLPQLPADYERQARLFGAVQRRRGVQRVADVLRALLAYVLCVGSLRELGAWAVLIGLADLSHVAWHKRLRKARGWLLWLLTQMLAVSVAPKPDWKRLPSRIVLVDATRLKEPGGRGDDWLVHLAYDLLGGHLHDVRISDRHTAEGFTLFPWQPGDLVVADRGYGRARQAIWVRSVGADVLVRLSAGQVRLLDESGLLLDVDAWLLQQTASSLERQVCWVDEQGNECHGRLIAGALTKEAAERARAKARRNASKQQQVLQERTLRLCGWVLLFTSLTQTDWSAEQVLALYRARWQVELVFKRMKQVLKLAQLRGKTAATNEAILLALLLSWVLQEQEATWARQVLSQALEEASPKMLSTWGINRLTVQTVRMSVQGFWTLSRLRACWPRLLRFVGSRRRKRLHQESQIRQFLRTHLQGLALSSVSCSSP